MSGENTGTIGKAGRGGKFTLKLFILFLSIDVLQRFKDVVPGPGSYFTI